MDLINKYLKEQTMTDTGWRKTQTDRRDQYGNRIKNVARSLARQGMRSAIKDLKKGPEAGKRQVEDVEEIDELKEPTVQKYITRAKFSTNPKRRAMAQKAQSKLQQKQNPMKTEEVELDEALRHEIAGAVGQFIGNKIDPVHGDIMRVHGKEAYRQAAFHIRKTVNDVKDAVSSLHDRLHKQLRTGGLTTEEVEELEELKRSTIRSYGDKRIKDLEGDKSVEAPFRPKPKSFSNPKRDAISTGLVRAAARLSGVKPTQKEEVEELDELKRSTLASYTGKAADQMAHAAIDKSSGATMGTMGRMSNMPDLAKKGSDKEDKAFSTILKRTKGITSASRRLAKEEAELEEELSSSQRDTHFSLMNKHRVAAQFAKGAEKDKHRMAALDHERALRNHDSQAHSSSMTSSNKLGVKEEVNLFKKYTELDEAKFPGFRVRMTSGGPKLPRRSFVPQGDQDPRTGMPLGFSPIKPEPKESDPSKKTKQG